MENQEIWTVGHSTHPIDKFLSILKSFGIEALVDVRSLPGSQKFPQFDKEALEISMPENHIEYIHLLGLGGRRKTSKQSRNTAWRLTSFRGYADYMETGAFMDAVQALEAIGKSKRTAYMCAEAVWWSCHRSLISDYLKFHGWAVHHIMGMGKAQEHPYTRVAKIKDNRLDYSNDEPA